MGWYEDMVNTINNFWYGPDKRPKFASANKKKNEKRLDKTSISEEDLKLVLHVKSVEFCIPENTKAHHTDKYACTEKREVEGGATEDAELVIRRGQKFTIKITFDRPFSTKDDDVSFIFENGELAETKAQTYGKFDVDETGKEKFVKDKWGGRMSASEGNTATFEVISPATCSIGEWSFFVQTRTKNKAGKTVSFTYECPDDFYMLFNPWCEEDTVYMKDSTALEEYVLNDHGCVFRGTEFHPFPKEWNFGQFEDCILETCLYIVTKVLKPTEMFHLANPVRVARIITQVVNSSDHDKGILYGRWDGKYSGGSKPNDWYGSVRIIRQYMKTKKPVKYGQCWVFSGVTTTVCRALGFPCRSVTNYVSAHDGDETNTIDKYYKFENGDLVPRDDNSDSVWNYHVWNEAWIKRSDIEGYGGKMDGWQAIDSTPQERSDGIYRCGPTPIYAIKHGMVSVPFDAGFVFAEVNADEVHYEPVGDGYRPMKIKCDKIGKCISTKIPNGERFDPKGYRQRMDLTSEYKYDDESTENRQAVMKAAFGARRRTEAYSVKAKTDDVEFKLLHDAELHLGQDVEVTLKATNKSDYWREIPNVTFRFLRQNYTGETAREPFKVDKQTPSVKLGKDEKHEFRVTLKHSDYFNHLDDGRCMCIQALAMVSKTRSRPMQNCIKIHNVQFEGPRLEAKLPSSVKVGEEFKAIVTFKNPINEELTECTAGHESGLTEHMTGVKQENVPPLGTFEGEFTIKPKRKGIFNITFKFNSLQLNYLSGAASIEVK